MNSEILSFKVYFSNGTKRYLYVKHLPIINDYIRQYGLSYISKIVFYFNLCYGLNYPYKCHSVTLENTNQGGFRIHFYHYYNASNEFIDFPTEYKVKDYICLLSSIKELCFYNQIVNPFVC